jgi:hypothetical protein
MKRRLVGVATAVLGTVLVGGAGFSAVAQAAPVPTTVTLPMFGAPLTLDITTGPGGALTSVSVDPATAAVATQLKPHKVVFQVANPTDPTADPAGVVVKSKNGGQKVSARAGSLKDVSGPGKWSGDVFGDGTASTVSFTVGAAADGSPDITAITTTGAKAVVGAVSHSSGEEDGNEQSAKVGVTFSTAKGDQSRTLSIKVKVETNEDGETSAKLSISLGRIKGVAVDAAAAAGAKTWAGVLCDNSAATISYSVAADGTVSGITTTPATATVKTEEGKIQVSFSDHERVRISVKLDNGQITIQVKEKINCDSPNPTTNASTSIPTPDTEGDHNGGGGGNGGGDDNQGGGDNHGRGDHAKDGKDKGDSTTTSTVA